MKVSKLIIATIALATAAAMTACSDDAKHVRPETVEVKPLAKATPETTTLFKTEYNEEKDCTNFIEVKTFSQEEARANDVPSSMAVCEERYKPVKNSEVSKREESDNVDEENAEEGIKEFDYEATNIRFRCIRASLIEKAKKASGACEG